MPKILIAECKQEVSTFNPQLSGYEDFAMRFGEELIHYHRAVRNEVGGALSIFDQRSDITLVPTASAFFITSGGTLADSAWQRIADELIEAIKAAGPVDAVYFCMHGAMATQSELDPEGWLLTKTREIVGEQTPIVVSLDLHGILTDRMLQQSNAIVAYHTYPHVDFFETGQRAARLLLRIMAGEVRPVTAKVAIPALVRGDELITATGLFGQSIRIAQEVEQQPKGLSAGMFIGNPFTDVPALQTYSFVVTDNDPELAQREALRIADTFWKNHERMFVPLKSLRELQQIALAHTLGTLGLVDAADATSSGASGDSNAVVQALMECGFMGRTLAPIVDAAAVVQARAAGVGATIRTAIGGTLDTARFQPLPITAEVVALSDGRFRSESFGEEWLAGPTAVLQSDNFVFVVSSRAVNLYDRSFFFAHGQDPRNFAAVVIKSPHCQGHMYAEWCSQMVNIDAPGSSSANLKYLGHQRCPRPIFPLDDNVAFTRQVKLFP
jgi:microcystin degradation protein MlrC